MATKIWLARSNDTSSWRGDFFGFGEVWPVPNDLAADFVTRLDHMRIGTITTTGSLEEGGRTSVAGPTSPQNTRKYLGSGVIESDFTISGTMTFNIWGFEANTSANATIRAVALRYRASDHSFATIIDSSFGTELGTSRAVRNWTGAPTSTDMLRGDRILFTISNDDATAVNMGAGFNVQWEYNGHTNAADGDSWFQFTETFDWMDHSEWEAGLTGTKLYLRDTDSPVSVGRTEKVLSSTPGTSVVSRDKRPSTNGPVAWPGEQTTDADGGTVMEWYTNQLAAFTLSFPTTVHFTAITTIDFDGPALVAELAVCDNDGSNAVVIARCMPTATAPNAMACMVRNTTQIFFGDFAAPNKAIAGGQRLRLRFYVSDCYFDAVRLLDTTNVTSITYDDDVPDADGDSYITFSQTLSDYVPPPDMTTVNYRIPAAVV